MDGGQVRRRLLRPVAAGLAVQRSWQGTVSPRGARRVVGRRTGEAAVGGAAIVDRSLEPARSAESEELVVAHGRDVRWFPRGCRCRQFRQVIVGCQAT